MKAQDFVKTLEGFDRADVIPLASYRDCSTVFVTPTRTMMIPHHHDAAVRRISPIQNQVRAYAILPCGEVSDAYNQAVSWMMSASEKYQYLFTLEDDNIPPWNVHLKLLEAMWEGGYDMIGGLYRSKAPDGMLMAWGDPDKGSQDGANRDLSLFIRDQAVVECNVLPTGCTIFHRSVFEDVKLEDGSWFRQHASPTGSMGHDFDFSLRARAAGKRMAVHCGVWVGHYDVSEGLCYWPHVPNPTRSLECPG